MFRVTLQQRDFNALVTPNDLIMTPVRWSSHRKGGAQQAEIDVDGPRQALYGVLDWLRCPIAIHNRFGTPVWWGYVASLTARFGGLEIGISIDEMANKINVTYSYKDTDGKSRKGETGWTSDADSISVYGTWEREESIGEATSTLATQRLTTLLNTIKLPVGVPSFRKGNRDRGDNIRLFCRGWYWSLAARYLSRADGVERHIEGGGTAIAVGQSLTARTIGFEPNNDYIHDLAGRMSAFTSGQRIKVSGAAQAGNNSTFLVTRGTNQTTFTVSSNQIYFDHVDDVMGTGVMFADIDANDMIYISGAFWGNNNGYFFVKETSGSNHVTVTPASIGDEDFDRTITIDRGNAIGIEGGLVSELPGASVTLTTVGYYAAQSFTVTAGVAWTAYEVLVRIAKIGAPVDGITVELRSDSAGNPGAVLSSGWITSVDIRAELEWMTATLYYTVTMTPAVTYWVVVKRSGASDHANYYLVDMDDEAGYSNGQCKLWNGAAWVAPSPVADMPFAVWGKEETTTQIANMVTATGEFLAGTSIADASGVYTAQYREGELRTIDEIDALLDTGANDGRNLMAVVSPDRWLVVSKEPTSSTGNLILSEDGTLLDSVGGTVEPGVLPTGQWVDVRGLPSDVLSSTRVSPFFAEASEYSAESGEISYTPKGAWTLEDLVGLE